MDLIRSDVEIKTSYNNSVYNLLYLSNTNSLCGRSHHNVIGLRIMLAMSEYTEFF